MPWKLVCWIWGKLQGDPALGHDTMPAGAGLALCKRCDSLVPLNPKVRRLGRAFEKRRDHQDARAVQQQALDELARRRGRIMPGGR